MPKGVDARKQWSVHVAGRKGQDLVAAARRIDAAKLRARGLSYRDIGAKLGISYAQAFKDVKAGLKALHGDLQKRAPELARVELERLEMFLDRLAVRIEEGDLDALEAWRKLSESRRKLLGVDAPEKVHVTQNIDLEIENAIRQLAPVAPLSQIENAPETPGDECPTPGGNGRLPEPPRIESRSLSDLHEGGDDTGPVAGESPPRAGTSDPDVM